MMTRGCLINAKAVDVARVLGILHHAQGTLQEHRAFTAAAVASVSLSQAGVSCWQHVARTWTVPKAESCTQIVTWRTLLADDALSSQLSPAPPGLIWSAQLSNVRCIGHPLNDEYCLVPCGAQLLSAPGCQCPTQSSELSTSVSRRPAKPV